MQGAAGTMPSSAAPGSQEADLRPYLQIARELGREIQDGAMPAGSRVAPLEELVRRTGRARETCRKALRELERAGLLEQHDSRPGYYVTAAAGRRRAKGEPGAVAGGHAGAQDTHPERAEPAMPGARRHRPAATGSGRSAGTVPLVNMFCQTAGSWPARTDHLRWLVVPVGEKSEQAAGTLASRHRYLAGYPGLTTVPPRWMHIAVGHAGPAGDLPEEDLDRLVDQVRGRCARQPAFSVTFGPPEVTPSGVTCPAYPAAALLSLGQLTADALRTVTSRTYPAPPAAAGTPHVVVAYATGTGTTAPVEKVVAARTSAAPPTRHRASQHIEVSTLHLARVRHDGRRLTWATVETVALLGQEGEAVHQPGPGKVAG